MSKLKNITLFWLICLSMIYSAGAANGNLVEREKEENNWRDNKMLLQSKDRWNDILLFDAETQQTHVLERSSSPEFDEAPIAGTFATVSGHLLMFYRFDSELRFSLDNQTVVIDELAKSSWNRVGEDLVFSIEKNNKEVIRFEYNQKNLEQPMRGDTTAHIEDEDFDFFLFVHKVLSNDERREFIYQGH